MKLLEMSGDEEKELGLRLLSNLQSDGDGCARIAELAAQDGPMKKIGQELLWRYDTARGGWPRTLGQQSAKVVVLKNTLEKARTLVTVPEADALIASVLASVWTVSSPKNVATTKRRWIRGRRMPKITWKTRPDRPLLRQGIL